MRIKDYNQANNIHPNDVLIIDGPEGTRAVSRNKIIPEIYEAEAWANGTMDGVPVPEQHSAYHNNAKYHAGDAALSATNAATSETNAATSETNAEASAISANVSKEAAASSETNAAASAAAAASSASDAEASAASIEGDVTESNQNALKAEGHAVGKQNGVDVDNTSQYYHNNAEYWANYARQYAEGGIHYRKSIEFADIPTSGMIPGDMYDIKDDFVTDSRFQDGAGIPCDAGTNIIWNTNNKWDVDIQGSGGHTILNKSGTELAQRSKLQFEGAIVSDDETNNATVVETVNPVDYEEDIYGVNLIPYPYKDALPKTSYGVTFTAGSNGAVVANGTNDGTGTSEYHFIRILGSELKSLMKNQPCILSGCPSGGTLESYRLNFSRTDSWETVKTDMGEGVTILPSDIEDSVQYIIRILITRNYTVPTNLTFKPMLRKATIKDDTYRPYNQQSIQNQLTKQTNVLGAKNLLPNTATTQVYQGVTFTVNDDKSITTNGTVTKDISFYIGSIPLLKKGDYILSGCPKEGNHHRYHLLLQTGDDADHLTPFGSDYGEGLTVHLETDAYVVCHILFSEEDQNYDINNLTFYPMLRLASDPDNTYVPYAMTNRELTDAVPFKFGVDANGNYGYIKAGADTVTPFKTKNVVDLGTGTSFNVSNIPGYQNFTADNFYLVINNYTAYMYGGYSQSSPTSSGTGLVYGQAEVKVNNGNNWNTDKQITPTKSYNPSTGVLTISNTSARYGIWVKTTSYRGGSNVSSSTSGGGEKTFGAYISVRALLIY